MKYRKKSSGVDAVRWRKNGDHPDDQSQILHDETGAPYLSEGKVVRYYRHPLIPGDSICGECGKFMGEHGWLDTREGGQIVCAGDYIVTGDHGQRVAIKPEIFETAYEPVEQ